LQNRKQGIHAAVCTTTSQLCWQSVGCQPPIACSRRTSCSAGLRLGGRLEDPLVAAALLWPDAAAEDPARLELRKLQAAVAPSFKVRLPPGPAHPC
jgi:hypothetical protein